MIKYSYLLLIGLVVLPLASCGQEPVVHNKEIEPAVLDELRSLKVENATQDAMVAISNNDFHIIVIYNSCFLYPGTLFSSVEDIQRYREKYGMRIVEGAGDDTSEPEYVNLNRNAYEYAQAYNHTILSAIDSR